jgi:deoxycytidine triphosphate deaminase
MATVLSDRDIKGLIGSVIKDAEPSLINPNGIELRLGHRARFISTGEECEIPPGSFLQIRPGESIVFASLESLDFSRETVSRIFPDCMLMALITPTTTMMREGAMNVATKVDAGFIGQLNWGLRNNSYKDLILQHGESIFKLTLLLLRGDEVPEKAYGDRGEDKYQHTEGIKLSGRRIPADIPKSKLIGSSVAKLDPKKQLREAGYPFDHIGSELIQLDGKFEMVSRDVASLTEKIEGGNKVCRGKDRRDEELGCRSCREPFFEEVYMASRQCYWRHRIALWSPELSEDVAFIRFGTCGDRWSRRNSYSRGYYHTVEKEVLELPTHSFYVQGVKANVIFFDILTPRFHLVGLSALPVSFSAPSGLGLAQRRKPRKQRQSPRSRHHRR